MTWVVIGHWGNSRMMDNNGGNGWWWLMGLGMLTVAIVAVVLVVWLIARTARVAGSESPRDPNLGAKQILNERLARGEIDSAEYQERLSQIA